MRDSLLNIMVVGTAEGIVMVESGAKEVSEEQVLNAIEFAHEQIKKICAAMSDLASEERQEKAGSECAGVRRNLLRPAHEAKVGTELIDALDTAKHPKHESYEKVREIKKALKAELPEDDKDAAAKLSHYYEAAARAHLPRAGNQRPQAAGFTRVSTRSAISGLKWACCRARTVRPSLPAAKPRRWLPPRWARRTTRSALSGLKARPKNASCCITTSRHFQWAKWAA